MRHLISPLLFAVALMNPVGAAEEHRPVILRDAHQQVTQVTMPQGERYDYQRDQRQQITTVAITSATGAVTMWRLTYQPDGAIVTIDAPTGPIDLTGATATWKGITLVVTSPGKPQRILLADPSDPAL